MQYSNPLYEASENDAKQPQTDGVYDNVENDTGYMDVDINAMAIATDGTVDENGYLDIKPDPEKYDSDDDDDHQNDNNNDSNGGVNEPAYDTADRLGAQEDNKVLYDRPTNIGVDYAQADKHDTVYDEVSETPTDTNNERVYDEATFVDTPRAQPEDLLYDVASNGETIQHESVYDVPDDELNDFDISKAEPYYLEVAPPSSDEEL